MKSVSLYTAMDYYGWDPANESVPSTKTPERCTHCGLLNDRDKKMCFKCGKKLVMQSPYRIMSNALIHSFFAYKAGVVLGTPFINVLKHLPEFRPYKGHDMLEWEDYFDQCYMITHVIRPEQLGRIVSGSKYVSHEYFFIIRNLPVHMYTEIHLVINFWNVLEYSELPIRVS